MNCTIENAAKIVEISNYKKFQKSRVNCENMYSEKSLKSVVKVVEMP